MKTLFYNGKIYKGHSQFATHFVVDGDQVMTPSSIPLESLINICDDAIDLQGKCVIPGFNDCHLHFASVGEWMDALNLSPLTSIDAIVEKAKTYAPFDFLAGRGWNEDLFTEGEKRPLTRYDLDRISTAFPIVFTRVCGHVAVCNSKAIEMLNIDETTTVIEGELLKDTLGKLNGLFTENAIKLLQPLYPEKNDALRKRHLKKAMSHANAFGITSVQSNDIMDPSHVPFFDCVKALQQEKALTVRYTFQFNFQDDADFEHYLETEFPKDDYDDIWISKGALKLYKDGSLGGRTALLRAPYHDAPDTRGVDTLLQERFEKLCTMAHQNGIQVIVHAIGDAAIEACIDLFEKLNGGHDNPLRHGIVHCQITDGPLLERIRKNHLTVFFQPIFIDYDHQIVYSRVGETLADTSYAIGTMVKNGTAIGFSTDAPVESVNPFDNLYCAVTRKGIGKSFVYNTSEAIDLETAIDAYTSGSAYVEHKEKVKGTLENGHFADFAILDRDLFTLEPEEWRQTQVLETYVGGQCVYKK